MDLTASLDEKLRLAIAHRRLIELRYGGKTRVVEPHDYGVQKAAVRLLAFQRSEAGGARGRGIDGWRLFDVAKIEACVVLDRTFPGSRGALHAHHYAWDELYARVK
jgi:hypothetical protein